MLKMINMWIANNIYKKSYPQNVDNFKKVLKTFSKVLTQYIRVLQKLITI